MPSQRWNPHANVNEHMIPVYEGAALPRRSANVLRSVSDGPRAAATSRAGRASGWGSDRQLSGSSAMPPTAASSTGKLTSAQAELYAALFGENAPKAAGLSPGDDGSEDDAAPTGVHAGDANAPELPNLELSRQMERAVRKAMRGAALEKRQAVEEAKAEAEAEKAQELARIASQQSAEAEHRLNEVVAETKQAMESERQKVRLCNLLPCSASHFVAGCHPGGPLPRQQVLMEAEKERERALARAVHAAEQRRDSVWQSKLEQAEQAAEVRLAVLRSEKESAVRRVNRAKDQAVAEVLKSARKKCDEAEALATQAAEAERERAAAAERAARRQALKQREALVEKTSIQAEQERERAVAAAKEATMREHKVSIRWARCRCGVCGVDAMCAPCGAALAGAGWVGWAGWVGACAVCGGGVAPWPGPPPRLAGGARGAAAQNGSRTSGAPTREPAAGAGGAGACR